MRMSAAELGDNLAQLVWESFSDFVSQEDVMSFVEMAVLEATRAVVPERPIRKRPFPRFSYREAIDRYGVMGYPVSHSRSARRYTAAAHPATESPGRTSRDPLRRWTSAT